MINKQRVKRIKNVIYTVLVILIFLPLILLIALFIGMMGFMSDASTSLGRIEEYISQTEDDGSGMRQTSASADMEGVESTPLEPDDIAEGPEVSGMSATGANKSAMPESPVDGIDDTVPQAGEPDTQPGSPDAVNGEGNGMKATPFDSPSTGRVVAGKLASSPNPYKPDELPDLFFDTLAEPEALLPGTLYLTFDNTPSGNFRDILDVLDRHGVKATFFVWRGVDSETTGDDFREITGRGHSIGIHSNTKEVPFSELYSSEDFFLNQFYLIFEKIYAETGVKTRLYRLPGGSASPDDTDRQLVLREIKAELDARGFLQYDWNASAQDAVYPAIPPQQILDNLSIDISEDGGIIALFHDGTNSDSTVVALDDFITRCKSDGFEFKAIDNDTIPVSFLRK